MRLRISNELADVRAAARFVQEKFQLDNDYIADRARNKISKYRKWDRGES